MSRAAAVLAQLALYRRHAATCTAAAALRADLTDALDALEELAGGVRIGVRLKRDGTPDRRCSARPPTLEQRRVGGQRGAVARLASLTPERRREIAILAGRASAAARRRRTAPPSNPEE